MVAVEAGASALGFIFYPKSPRYVTPEKARELGAGLDVLKVGVFVDETPAAIEVVMRAAKLDVAQIYGGSALAGAPCLGAFRVPTWKPGQAIQSTSDPSRKRFCWTAVANGVTFRLERRAGLRTA